ncbi:hypothetical protein KI688_005696 [Linnemannia hyalina]|uniref:EH domain-containing protein n=1 Tax=Linnemannia hyalina TaxID=64524 RepID=A0A9P8BWF1_9FUNG|nr:hypothetical protein KI688_005696 [Linnemannia hyalina]
MSFFFSKTPKNALRLSPAERQLYDSLWKQANPQGAARLGAVQAVEFLNLKSRPTLNLAGLRNAAAAYPPTSHSQFTGTSPAAAWPSLPLSEMKTYRDLFKSLDKENGILKYDIVLQIMLKAGIPTETLAKILVLVDRAKRAGFDEDEFVMAMYFVMCLKRNTIKELPPSLPAEVMKICQVKELPSPNPELNYDNVLSNPNPNASIRERELLSILQTQQQQQQTLQEVYLRQILENSKSAEQRMYQQGIDQSRANQEQLAPLLAANAFGNGPQAAIFAESYNNAMKQQQVLMERIMAASNPLPTTLPQVPTDNPPPYSGQQPGVFSTTTAHQQPGAFSPVPAHQQQYPQFSQYQQPPLQAYPLQLQQAFQPQAIPVYTQQQQQAFQPQAIPVYTQQQQQYNPYAQYTQQTPTSPGQQGAAGYQSYPPPPQGNLQYQSFESGQPQQHTMSPRQPQQHVMSPGQPQQYPLSPGNPQQLPMSPGNPQQQPMSPGNPQYQFAQGQPTHQQQQHQQPLSPGGSQQYIPPRHPQMYGQLQGTDPLNAPLPPTPTSPVGPPLPSRAPQDRNDYSTTAAVPVTSTTTTTTAVSSGPPPLPHRSGQQQQYQPAGPQEIPGPSRAPQYIEPTPEARRPFGAPQLR